NLNTLEEIKAFLEPYSPPAPPPQITIKRTRAKRNVEKIKEKSFDDDDEDSEDGDEDVDDIAGGDDEEIDLGLKLPKGDDLEDDLADDDDEADSDSDEDDDGDDDD